MCGGPDTGDSRRPGRVASLVGDIGNETVQAIRG
jgi:hypothetical protein